MRQEDLQKAVKPKPFVPSRIHLSDGTTFEVPHPDFISVGPRTTALLVNGTFHIINNLHINYVEPLVAAD